MMEDIKVIEAFNFVNAKGDKITVQRGVNMEDNTLRYRVYGNHIPFPIWCGTWFMGIPWGQFLSSFAELGYSLYAKANMHTGMVTSDPIEYEAQANVEAATSHALFAGVDAMYRKGNEEEARILYEMAREVLHWGISSYEEYVENIPEVDPEMEMDSTQYQTLLDEIVRAYRLGEEDRAYCLYGILQNGNSNCPDYEDIILGHEKGTLSLSQVTELDRPFLREAIKKILSAPGQNKMTAVKLARKVTGQKLSTVVAYVDRIRSEMEE